MPSVFEMPQLPEAESHYDLFAHIYNAWLAEDFCRRALPVLQELLLADLPAGSNILDLCCGTGQMARSLTQLGFHVTGLDASPEMLKIARSNVPDAQFVCADARNFLLQHRFDTAISTFNSLAHIVSPQDLTRVFRSVKQALRPGAPFLFDLSMEEAYTLKWRGAFACVTADHACVVRPGYDKALQIGTNQITVFCRNNAHWHRQDFTITQKCHSADQIRSSLRHAGYDDVRAYDAERDLGMEGESGRCFFLCR